jgi:hypothetical protein
MGKKKEYAFSLPLLGVKIKKHIPSVKRVSAWG